MTVSKGVHNSRVSVESVIDQSMTVSKGAPYSRVSVESVIDRSMTLFNKLL